jgi:hypothetical protein
VAAVGAQEHVPACAAKLRGARAPLLATGLELPGEQVIQERRKVHGQPRLEPGAAVGVVFGREAVEPAVDLVELPFDVDLAGDVVSLQADRLTPAQLTPGGFGSERAMGRAWSITRAGPAPAQPVTATAR